MSTAATPRPLTDADMEQMGPDFRVDGIPCVFLGEDSEWVVGLGHIRPDRFVEALAAWWAENDMGYKPELDESMVEHKHAVADDWPAEDSDDDGPFFRWVASDEPGAFPVTVVDMEG
jgi:hypothetical protein